MNDKVRRMRRFQWAMEIKWFDLSGYHELPNGNMVRLTLATNGISGEYECIVAKVFNQTSGAEIDGKRFLFADYLEWPEGKRKAHASEKMCISSYNDYKWTVTPESTRELCAAIEEWIDMFR